MKTIGDRILIRRHRQPPEGGAIALPHDNCLRQPHFTATVIGIGTALSEEIRIGDEVIIGPCVSQYRVGSQKVEHQGEMLELISTLDVIGILV